MHQTTRPLLASIVCLGALFGCDDGRRRSVGEDEPTDAALDDGGAPLDRGPDAAPPVIRDGGPTDETPAAVLMVGRDDAQRPQLVQVDPATGATRTWGPPIDLPDDWTLHEVLHDPALERVIVRYGHPVPPGVARGSNFAFAGYLRAERDGPWETLVHADDVVELVAAPDLRRISLLTRDRSDPTRCTDIRVVDFDGELLDGGFEPREPCDDLARTWGMGPGYRVVRQRLYLSFALDGGGSGPVDRIGDVDADSRLLGLYDSSALVLTDGQAWWSAIPSASSPWPTSARPAFAPDGFLIFGDHTFHAGDLWTLVDGDASPLGSVDPPFTDARPPMPPLADAPGARGNARALWLYVRGGVWTGALVDAQFLEAVGDAPVPEINRSVLDAWRRDPATGVWSHRRLREADGPARPFVRRAGRYALWADGCDLVRYDFEAGALERAPLEWPLADVAVGVPGWWGGLDDGDGRAGRDAAGQPVVDPRPRGWGRACPEGWPAR